MNDSTGGDGGRRGRRRSATGAREDSRNVSVRLRTRNRASSSRTEPASLESGRTPPLPRRTRRCGSRGCSVRSSRAHGGDARETHLRFFGASGAARHQKGVALFRVRHARGSGHRRRSAQVTRTRLGAGLQHVAVTNDKSSISYETQSHACICPKDETVRAPISFSFSFLEEDETKGVFSFASRLTRAIAPTPPRSRSCRPFSFSPRARATWRARRSG